MYKHLAQRFLSSIVDPLVFNLVDGIMIHYVQQPFPQSGSHSSHAQQNSSSPQPRPPKLTSLLAWIITILVVSLIVYFIVFLITSNFSSATFGGIIVAIIIASVNFPHTHRTFDPIPQQIEQWLDNHLKAVFSIGIPSMVILLVLFSANVVGLLQVTSNGVLIRWGLPTKVSSNLACPPLTDSTFSNLSYGNRVFDREPADNGAKIDTAKQYVSGQSGAWEDLHKLDPGDPETLIYAQDQRIMENKQSYFTLVLPTNFVSNEQTLGQLTDDDHVNGASRDLLRGASIEQGLYNKFHGSPQMLLMIANIPTLDDTLMVENQIIRAQCYHIAGLIGWPYGADTSVINTAHIPVVSPIPFSENQQGLPFFFSIAPSIDDQAQAMTTTFTGNNPFAVIYEKDDEYSYDIASSRYFKDSASSIGFDPGSNEFLDEVSAALEGNPNLNLLYFVGYPLEAMKLLLLVENYQSRHPGRQITILGSNTLYQDVNCPPKVCPSDQYPGQFQSFYYAAFSFADERSNLFPHFPHFSPSPFFSEFSNQFDPHQLSGPAYYHGRPDSDAILAYDATAAFGRAFDTASTPECDNSTPCSDAIRKALQQFTGSHALLGASGQISFNTTDGTAQQKAILILHILRQGRQYQPPLFGSYCGAIFHCKDGSISPDAKEFL